MNSALYKYRNMFARRGAQFVPILIFDKITLIYIVVHLRSRERMRVTDSLRLCIKEKKGEIGLNPMTKAPSITEKQRDNTKNATKTSITQHFLIFCHVSGHFNILLDGMQYVFLCPRPERSAGGI